MKISPPTRLHVVKDPAPPGSPEWARLVTASKVAAIMGESNYSSPYAVHCLMNGVREDTTGMADRFLTGHAMELALRYWMQERHPEWRFSTGEVQVTHPGLPFPNAATLDVIATDDGRRRGPKSSRSVQFKTVGDWDEYRNLTPETVPAEWLIQVTWEMLISGLTQHPAILAVAGPFYDWREFEVPYDAELAAILVSEVLAFVATLDGPPPAPTAPRDYKIAKLRHPDVDVDADPVTIDAATAREWDLAKTEAKTAAAAKRAADKRAETAGAAILEALGTATVAVDPDGHPCATRTVTKRGIVLRHVPLMEAE